ncbi:hypothetical protein SDC9_187704 [bioreactor metagenome]|uniref:Uncharacterized protein n=1 Tax=bioreactor metagenome TaxID=1076179 RepID=A0A645HM98_9ZZZZ
MKGAYFHEENEIGFPFAYAGAHRGDFCRMRTCFTGIFLLPLACADCGIHDGTRTCRYCDHGYEGPRGYA